MVDKHDENMLLGYVEGTLTDTELARVRMLMRSDPRLEEMLEGMKGDKARLKALPEPQAPQWLMDDVDQQLERAMLMEEGAARNEAIQHRQRQRMRRVIFNTSLAAMLLIVATVVIHSLSNPPATPSNNTVATTHFGASEGMNGLGAQEEKRAGSGEFDLPAGAKAESRGVVAKGAGLTGSNGTLAADKGVADSRSKLGAGNSVAKGSDFSDLALHEGRTRGQQALSDLSTDHPAVAGENAKGYTNGKTGLNGALDSDRMATRRGHRLDDANQLGQVIEVEDLARLNRPRLYASNFYVMFQEVEGEAAPRAQAAFGEQLSQIKKDGYAAQGLERLSEQDFDGQTYEIVIKSKDVDKTREQLSAWFAYDTDSAPTPTKPNANWAVAKAGEAPAAPAAPAGGAAARFVEVDDFFGFEAEYLFGGDMNAGLGRKGPAAGAAQATALDKTAEATRGAVKSKPADTLQVAGGDPSDWVKADGGLLGVASGKPSAPTERPAGTAANKDAEKSPPDAAGQKFVDNASTLKESVKSEPGKKLSETLTPAKPATQEKMEKKLADASPTSPPPAAKPAAPAPAPAAPPPMPKSTDSTHPKPEANIGKTAVAGAEDRKLFEGRESKSAEKRLRSVADQPAPDAHWNAPHDPALVPKLKQVQAGQQHWLENNRAARRTLEVEKLADVVRTLNRSGDHQAAQLRLAEREDEALGNVDLKVLAPKPNQPIDAKGEGGGAGQGEAARAQTWSWPGPLVSYKGVMHEQIDGLQAGGTWRRLAAQNRAAGQKLIRLRIVVKPDPATLAGDAAQPAAPANAPPKPAEAASPKPAEKAGEKPAANPAQTPGDKPPASPNK